MNIKFILAYETCAIFSNVRIEKVCSGEGGCRNEKVIICARICEHAVDTTVLALRKYSECTDAALSYNYALVISLSLVLCTNDVEVVDNAVEFLRVSWLLRYDELVIHVKLVLRH